MTATIIPFPSHRFTAVDVARLDDLATVMIAVGAWGRVQYLSDGATAGLGFDAVLIYLPDGVFPVFTIERQKNGDYTLIDCTTMAALATARTLDGALVPLQPVIRLAEAGRGDALPSRLQWNLW